MDISLLWAGMLSYILGSIPTAYLFGRWLKGLDIRQHGSRNVGATNAFRVLGKPAGIIVLLLDVLKGVLPLTLLAGVFQIDDLVSRLVLGIAVVCGHNWSLFLRFQGGKGIATSLGVLTGLVIRYPDLLPVLAGSLGLWALVFLSSGYVSLASLAAALLLPLFMVITAQPWPLVVLGVLFSCSVVYRHRTNIKRLRDGSESRVRLWRRGG